MPFQSAPVNIADQISVGPFSLSCHQFTATHGPSGAIIDDVLEWDEGEISSNFSVQG